MVPKALTPLGPPCPECNSVNTIQTHDRLDETMYFCAACEHAWMLVGTKYVDVKKGRKGMRSKLNTPATEQPAFKTCPQCDSWRGVMSVPETHKGSDFSWYRCGQCNHLWSRPRMLPTAARGY
jgi:transposase-like protein